MAVKVITDSTSDIPAELARELEIKVVPVYVSFGDTVYHDGVDIGVDDFYRKLAMLPDHPATSQPSPEDFADAYREHAKVSDGIVTITISSKISGTYNSAVLAKSIIEDSIPVEVIDSKFNSAGLGLVVIAAARLARTGASLSEIIAEAHRAIDKVHMFGMFQTMTYLARSGRVSKAIAAASRMLKVMPLLTFRDGEIFPAGFVRTVTKGMDRIYDFVRNNLPVSELTVVHSAVPDQADQLKQRLEGFIPGENICMAELGAGLGVHGGPGVLLVALRRQDGK